jgi:hypothetical protein
MEGQLSRFGYEHESNRKHRAAFIEQNVLTPRLGDAMASHAALARRGLPALRGSKCCLPSWNSCPRSLPQAALGIIGGRCPLNPLSHSQRPTRADGNVALKPLPAQLEPFAKLRDPAGGDTELLGRASTPLSNPAARASDRVRQFSLARSLLIALPRRQMDLLAVRIAD